MGRNTTTGRFAFVLLAVIVVIMLRLLASPYYLLALVFACALAGSLFLLHFPKLAYYAIVIMIPFGSFRHIQAGGLEIKLDWLAASVLLVGMVVHHAVNRRINNKLKSHLWFPLTLFFGVSMVSAFLSNYPDVVVNDIKLLVASYILIMLTLFNVTRHSFTKTMPFILVGSIMLSAFLGLIGYLFNISLFAEGITEHGFKRALGGTIDANSLSMIIVFVVPITGYLMLHSRNWWQRLALSGMLLSSAAATIVTFSRGGSIMFVISILAFFAMHRHRLTAHNFGLFIGIIGIICAITLTLIPQAYWERHLSLATVGDRSVKRRITYLYVAADSFIKAPFLGHGPGTFAHLYAESDYSSRFAKTPEDRFRRAHNTYIEVLIGTGVVGLILFGIIIIMAIRDFGRASSAAYNQGDFNLAELIKTYRLSFILLLIYIFIFSDFQNKYLLLSIAFSQIALQITQEEKPA